MRYTGIVEERAAILIVDDTEVVRRLLARHLSRAGWRCDEAADGAEALRLLEAGRRYAAIVTDLRMPRVDGRELLARVRSRAPAVPVILISADAVSDVPGAAAVLRKRDGFADEVIARLAALTSS